MVLNIPVSSWLSISRKLPTALYKCKSNKHSSFLPQRSSQNPVFFSTAWKCHLQRHIPNTIALPTYVTSSQLKAPSVAEIKTDDQISQMLPACKLAAEILRHIGKYIKAGIKTEHIDDLVYSKCIEAGAYPSPLMYKGFPKSVCTSVNEVACHGIPGPRVLNEGDIINVDVTVFFKGYHGDTSATFSVGEIDQRSRALMRATQDCLRAGISVCRDGALFSEIGEIIFKEACEAGFEVIPFFCGHGIGTYFHGPPDIVHVPSDHCGSERMKAGMTFTIEPILCTGHPEIKVLDDGWTVVTADGSWSAQYEHTILVTEKGSQILTE
ncbi:methionine aminopeptidase [Plakobranchus ocellatus]|uniref:Methionine aminopeptidase n=1 Tax=Plakobranchus ocellatus TaxID=259542 RepID=A0AAV4BMM8_9GAST|nr:methionine aminopeptidase [Plakobranchus ocellatus]